MEKRGHLEGDSQTPDEKWWSLGQEEKGFEEVRNRTGDSKVKLTRVSNAVALRIGSTLRQLPVWEGSSRMPCKAERVSPGQALLHAQPHWLSPSLHCTCCIDAAASSPHHPLSSLIPACAVSSSSTLTALQT